MTFESWGQAKDDSCPVHQSTLLLCRDSCYIMRIAHGVFACLWMRSAAFNKERWWSACYLTVHSASLTADSAVFLTHPYSWRYLSRVCIFSCSVHEYFVFGLWGRVFLGGVEAVSGWWTTCIWHIAASLCLHQGSLLSFQKIAGCCLCLHYFLVLFLHSCLITLLCTLSSLCSPLPRIELMRLKSCLPLPLGRWREVDLGKHSTWD